jgi:pimeloyl-ACP methyl ester carboxylesterase
VTEITHRQVDANGISVHIAEAGTGPLVVLCHGFPELWYSWRHQIPALAAAGYHVVAPDMRGYGRTDAPEPVEAYTTDDIAGDIVGVVDAVGADRAVLVGHDWGAAAVWHTALRHPDRVRAVANLSVPFRRRSAGPPMDIIAKRVGDMFFYQLYFQPVGPADTELAKDVRRSMRSFMHSWSGEARREDFKALEAEGTGLLDTITDPGRLPSYLTEDDFEVYVSEFERTGWTGGLNWYRCMNRSWEKTADLAGAKVTQPTLFVAGERDGVLLMIPLDQMEEDVPGLRRTVIVPGAGHWVQQEAPDAANDALVGFLGEL